MSDHIVLTGANRGIGLEMARQAAAAGARVEAIVRDPDRAQALAEAARAADGRIAVHGADVTDADALARVAAAVEGPVDLLICNAGQYRGRGSIGDPVFAAEDWREVLMTNVAGVFLSVEAFLPLLERSDRGRIAVVSSQMASSERAPGGSYIYRASKAAATNLARNLAADLERRGIAVGAYHPGWVQTDMGGASADIDAATSAKGLLERFAALGPSSTGVFEDYRGQPMLF